MFTDYILVFKILLGLSVYTPVAELKDHKLIGYLEDFKRDMEVRGIGVDYSKLKIRVVDRELDEDVAGETFFNNSILLKTTYKKAIVYHELAFIKQL